MQIFDSKSINIQLQILLGDKSLIFESTQFFKCYSIKIWFFINHLHPVKCLVKPNLVSNELNVYSFVTQLGNYNTFSPLQTSRRGLGRFLNCRNWGKGLMLNFCLIECKKKTRVIQSWQMSAGISCWLFCFPLYSYTGCPKKHGNSVTNSISSF